MARHLLHRFLLTFPALWLVLTLVFLLIHPVPGDPVYGHYLKQISRGDLGQSFKFQAPVRQVILERYPATLQLACLALLVCVAIAFSNARRLPARPDVRPPVGGCARPE